ncbi:MAG: hypothetical protein ACTSUO_06000 [Candidatus Thorarchaeota archaeon]
MTPEELWQEEYDYWKSLWDSMTQHMRLKKITTSYTYPEKVFREEAWLYYGTEGSHYCGVFMRRGVHSQSRCQKCPLHRHRACSPTPRKGYILTELKEAWLANDKEKWDRELKNYLNVLEITRQEFLNMFVR